MAVFKGRDEALPLLTQFYQLDIPAQDSSGGEMDAFLRGYGPMTSGEKSYMPLSSREVWMLSDVQAITRRVMVAVAENGPISTNDLALIERGSKRAERTLGYTSAGRLVSDAAGPHAIEGDYVWPGYVLLDHGGRPADNLIGEVCKDLKWALVSHIQMAICPVCRSVFVKGRPDQSYCSVRDGKRASAKEQYLRKKILQAA